MNTVATGEPSRTVDTSAEIPRRLCRNCDHFVACVEDHHGWCVWALGEINADRPALPEMVHGPRADSARSLCGERERRILAVPDPVTGRTRERVTTNWDRVTCEACLTTARQ